MKNKKIGLSLITLALLSGCSFVNNTDKTNDSENLEENIKMEFETALVTYGFDIQEENGEIIIQLPNGIMFNKSDDRISDVGKLSLDKISEIVTQMKRENDLRIVGHTDNTGDVNYNFNLSNERAKSVAFYLHTQNFPATNITYTGRSDLMPIASNDTEEGRELNRRVTIRIISK